MNDLMEMMFFRQMLGGGDSWVQAVFLAGVFLVVLFRRDQIVSPYMFRVSVILYVLSYILPLLLSAVLQFTLRGSGRVMGRGPGDSGELLQILMTAVGPLLLGLAIMLCVLSMLPPQSRYPGPPQRPPQPHPLD